MNDAFGRPQSIVVLGGTSDIARELVKRVAPDRCRSVVLAGRDADALEHAAASLRTSVPRVECVTFDARDAASAAKTVTQCFEAAGEAVDLVVLAVGELGEQDADERDPARVAQMLTVNLTWPAAALGEAAAVLRAQGHGSIVVLSSVAGFRVRRANYIYGSSKAGLDAYAVGLGEALRDAGVRVHVVRPGFVHTKMTEGRDAAPFAVGPDRVADDIARGLRRDQAVIWSPGVLRFVFSAFRLLPQAVWRKLPG
jgi:decaprenylphospho-beta-D-erythro-pentofuranosid-2-ulose 2-reductase